MIGGGFPFGTTVVVLRSGPRDGHGDRGPEVEHPLPGAAVAPRPSTESDVRGEQVTVGLTLLVPAGADVRATDRVRIPAGPFAGTYDVMGKPAPVISPLTGWSPGMSVALQDIEG